MLLTLVCAGLVSACAATRHDTSTDVEVARAYAALSGDEANINNVCVARPERFPALVLVGAQGEDLSCLAIGFFVDGVWETDAEVVSQEALLDAGWEAADAQGRSELARAFFEEVIHAWAGTPMTRDDRIFSASAALSFEPMSVTPTGDGGVVVRAWVREPHSATGEQAYHRTVVTFDPDGEVSGEVVARHRVNLAAAGLSPDAGTRAEP